ncbi:MAG: hypothetical protein ABI772_06315, partial [Bacteroidota bacterium]
WSIISGGGTLSSIAQTATPSTVTYTPVANFTGSVTLRLTTNAGAGCSTVTADRTITISATPTATAGATLYACPNVLPVAIPLSGASVGGGATTGAWSIISGGGSLNNTSQTATPATVTYTPAAIFSGTVTLRLTSNFGAGCSAATSDRTIIVQNPSVNAAGPNSVCQSASPVAITLTGATISGGAGTAAWSIISGGGILSSTAQTATPATVTYTPAANFSGAVTLRLTSNIPSGCSAVTSNRTININAITTATAGGPNTACETTSPVAITLTGASVGGSATTGAWSIISGGGTLSSTAQTASPATVTYTPPANTSGTVTLRLTSNFGTGCSAAISDRTINLVAAFANAGGPNTVCQSASPVAITLSGATIGGSATTAAWSIFSGGGILSSTAQTASPATVTYTPAANFSGLVTLRLTTNSGTGCTNTTSDRFINVTTASTANAGGPNNVCQSPLPAAITLSGANVGGGAATGAWSIISGGGTLSSIAQTATPATVTYTPAANFTGTVTLRLTSNFGTGCSAAISNRTINVNAKPIPSISGTLTICPPGSTVLNAGVFNSYIWSTSAVTQTINVNAAGTYTVTVTNANGCTGTASAAVTVSGACNVTLNLKAMIEGYYRGAGMMDSVLVNSGQGGSSSIADSITIELHDQNSYSLIVATKKVALLRNGMAQAIFPAAISGGTYYIVVRGRTFVETWSKFPITFTAVTNFNFTP